MRESVTTVNRVTDQLPVLKAVLLEAGDMQFISLRDLICEVLDFEITFLEARKINRLTLQEVLQFGPDVIIFSGRLSVAEYSFIQSAKDDIYTANVPIVVLSDSRDSVARVEAYKVGVDQFVEWPFAKDEVGIRINNSLRRKAGPPASHNERIGKAPGMLSLEQRFFVKVLAVIEENISNSNFSVDLLAREMNLSRAQFFRKFKHRCDVSPNALINELRLKLAANMISERVNTITQICYEVGFNDEGYFAKRFKKRFGVSPKQYAELCKEEGRKPDDLLANLQLR